MGSQRGFHIQRFLPPNSLKGHDEASDKWGKEEPSDSQSEGAHSLVGLVELDGRPLRVSMGEEENRSYARRVLAGPQQLLGRPSLSRIPDRLPLQAHSLVSP